LEGGKKKKKGGRKNSPGRSIDLLLHLFHPLYFHSAIGKGIRKKKKGRGTTGEDDCQVGRGFVLPFDHELSHFSRTRHTNWVKERGHSGGKKKKKRKGGGPMKVAYR